MSPKSGLVLCVDEYESILDGWRILLSSVDYEVLTAADWKSAMCLFKARPVELVILDQELPCQTCAIMTEALKNERPEVPILLVADELRTRREDLESADAWVLKSAPINILLSKVATLVAPKCNCTFQPLAVWNQVARTRDEASQCGHFFPTTRVA